MGEVEPEDETQLEEGEGVGGQEGGREDGGNEEQQEIKIRNVKAVRGKGGEGERE